MSFGSTFTLTFECSAHLMQRIIAYFVGPNPGLLEFSTLQFWTKHDWSLKNTSRLNKSSFYTYTLKPNGAAVYINSCALIVTRHKLKTWTSFILSHRSKWPKCIQMRRKKFRVSKPPCNSLKTKTTASFYHLLDCLDFLSFFFFFFLFYCMIIFREMNWTHRNTFLTLYSRGMLRVTDGAFFMDKILTYLPYIIFDGSSTTPTGDAQLN